MWQRSLILAGCLSVGSGWAQTKELPATDDHALAARARLAAAAAGETPGREAANFLLHDWPATAVEQLAGTKPATSNQLAQARQVVAGLVVAVEHGRDWPRPQPITIPRATGGIEIDGAVVEAAWQKSWTTTSQYRYNERERRELPATRWRMLWDDRYLYFAFECDDAKIIAPALPRDGAVYNGDCVELFLRTPAEPVRYWEIVVSPTGSVFDAFHTKKMNGWGPECGGEAATLDGLRFATRERAGGYVTEIAVPFAAFPECTADRSPQAGDKLFGLLARFDKTDTELRTFSVVPLLSWGHNIWNYIPLILGAP